MFHSNVFKNFEYLQNITVSKNSKMTKPTKILNFFFENIDFKNSKLICEKKILILFICIQYYYISIIFFFNPTLSGLDFKC